MATVVANYASDFPVRGETTSGWDYQWNAPVAGDVSTGAIDDSETRLSSLLPVGNGHSWTPDGDLDPQTQSNSAYLKLTAAGGHPGYGANNFLGSVDRYAIASYTVSEAGVYSIDDSFISLYPGNLGAQTNGIEVRLFVNSDSPIDTVTVNQNTRAYFDASFGFLSPGDTIHVAVGAKGDLVYDFFSMDFDVVHNTELEQPVANYRSDFSTRAPDQLGWSYLWNAPQNWAVGDSGSLSTVPIGAAQNYQPLISTGEQWTADGDLNGLNSNPDFFLRLNSQGGFTGNGYLSDFFQDRFAIAAFTVPNSGRYGITDSFVSVSGSSADGVEVLVHTSDESATEHRSMIVGAGGIRSFDTGLGYLEKGETIYVAFGANRNHIHDRFEMDFQIVRELPRAAPDLSLNDSTLDFISANDSRFGDAGAIPNDNLNDWPAINNAIIAAGAGDAEISLTPGTYNVSSSELDPFKPLFNIWNKNNLIINGNGSTLIVGDYSRGLFQTGNSSNVLFKNFVIDYAERIPAVTAGTNDLYRPLSFTQGVITSIDPTDAAFTIRVNLDAFLAPDDSFTRAKSEGWGYAIDPLVNGRLKTGTLWHYGTLAVEPTEQAGEFRILSNRVDGLAVGDRYVMQRRLHNAPVFGVYTESENISFLGITAYSSPSVFINSLTSDSINVIDSHVVIRPDDQPQNPNTERWKSINADGIHAQSNRVGPWVENSTFEGLGDDVMNFYSLPLTVLEQLDSRRLVLASLIYEQIGSVHGSALQVGDRLNFFDPLTGTTIEEAKIITTDVVARVDPANPTRTINARVVELDQTISGILIGTHDDQPKYRNETIVYNRDSSKGALVQNNVLANSRRYGNLLLADDTQLVDNVFEGLGDTAIAIHNEFEWPLGALVTNSLIQGNQFINNGVSSRYLADNFHTGTISVKAGRYDADQVDATYSNQLVDNDLQLFSNLRILDNLFQDWRKTAISIRNSESVLIQGNTILQPALSEYEGKSLDLHFSKNVFFRSNTVL